MNQLLPTSRRQAPKQTRSRMRVTGIRRRDARRWTLALLLGCVALLAGAPVADAASPGAISGTVTEAAGAHSGIADVEVFVTTANGYYAGATYTESAGKYEVKGLAPGSYIVEFEHPYGVNFSDQYYEEASSRADAKSVTVAESTTAPNINAKLKVGGEITGTVKGAGVGGLGEVEVDAYQVSGGGEAYGYAYTEADGDYTIVGLQTGAYDVEFYPEYGSELNFIPQYFAGGPPYNGAPLESGATAVSVTEAAPATANIDAELQVGGEISGTVTDAATHKPIANEYIEIDAYNVLDAPGSDYFGGYAETNANGEYTIRGLASGSYNLAFYAYPENTGAPEYIEQADNGVGVTVKSKTSGVNVALVRKEPVNTTAPVASGTLAVGQALSCTRGSWTGESTLTYAYTWLRNGSAIASGSTYLVQAADQGNSLSCKVTATNKYGSAGATSNTLKVPAAIVPPGPLPLRLPKPEVKLSSSKLVVSGGSALVPLACAAATCTGTIELTEQVVVKSKRKGKQKTTSKKKTVVLAKGSYALAAGKSVTFALRLTAAGKSALAKAKGHKLAAKASVTVTGGTTVQKPVVLSQAVKAKHKKSKHK